MTLSPGGDGIPVQGHAMSFQTWNVQKFLIVNVGCLKPLGLSQFAAQHAWSGGSRSQDQETDSKGVYYNILWVFILSYKVTIFSKDKNQKSRLINYQKAIHIKERGL